MSKLTKPIDITVPDLGEFDRVPVIEIFVEPGETVSAEAPLVALESDKAVMEIPASEAGIIHEILVKTGDRVSEGQRIATLRPQSEMQSEHRGSDKSSPDPDPSVRSKGKSETTSPATSVTQTTRPGAPVDQQTDLVVLGAGPGGYTAAFRAADLGLKVTLVERYPTLGGVCLNVGCIPSKALLHVAKVISDSQAATQLGVRYATPEFDLPTTRQWKSGLITQLTRGLDNLAKKRGIRKLQGVATFDSANIVKVDLGESSESVSFDKAIIATGSQPIELPGFPYQDPHVLDSTGALELNDIPHRLLIIGGGIIGLEMATVYHALGSKINIVEMAGNLMAGADPDLVRILVKRIKSQYENLWLKTSVTGMEPADNGVNVSFAGKNAPSQQIFDKVLVCVGRTPNGHRLNVQTAGIHVTDQGFIPVNRQQQTNISHIFAIGDIVGQPMLAHKAVHEGKVAAEVAAGLKSGFDARVIPSVAYTDPEVAWVGMTEVDAKARDIVYGKGIFPWTASGRSLTQGGHDGVTKLLFDKPSGRLIGAGIVGHNAGDLIAEAALAIEMGADAQDISLTIHPHPTLAETLGFAAEMFEGTITDLYLPKRKSPVSHPD